MHTSLGTRKILLFFLLAVLFTAVSAAQTPAYEKITTGNPFISIKLNRAKD